MCRIVECLQNFVFKVFFEYYSIKDFGFATNLYVHTLHAVDAVLIKQHVGCYGIHYGSILLLCSTASIHSPLHKTSLSC